MGTQVEMESSHPLLLAFKLDLASKPTDKKEQTGFPT